MMDVSRAKLSTACKSEHMDTLKETPQLGMQRSHLA